MLKKYVFGAILFVLIAMTVVAMLHQSHIKQNKTAEYGGQLYSAGDSKEGKLVKLWIGTRKMQDTLGGNNIYADYYKQVKTIEIDRPDEAAAIKSTERDILKKYARYRAAEKAGISVSEKELKEHVKNVLKDMRSSDDYRRIDNLYRRQGTTFEKEYIANRRWNLYDATSKKLSECIVQGDPKCSKGNLSDLDTAKGQDKLVSDYRRTKEGVALEKALRSCEEALKKYGSNAKAVKKYYGSEFDFSFDQQLDTTAELQS